MKLTTAETYCLLIDALTSVKETLFVAVFQCLYIIDFKFAQPFPIHQVISFFEQKASP